MVTARLLSAHLIASISTITHAQTLTSFESFIELHGRTYQENSDEYQQRKSLYDQRKAEAELHNSLPTRLWTAGVNKLWDWTESELQTLRGWDGSMRPGDGSSRTVRKHAVFLQSEADLPKEKIWSNLAMSHRIKNQGDCGSCWAIASASVLEAHYEIYKGTPRTFSAQQIVACTPNPRHCGGDGGCKGATAELAMDWVLKNGCPDESEAPYSAGGSCHTGSATLEMAQILSDSSAAPAASASLGMTGWETLPKNTYEPLARTLAERGPVAVSVAADSWFNYESGIFNNCGKDAVIDHAVVALGYGEESGVKYWVIQNSWGQDWGENGHIRLQRHDSDDYCGMNNDPQKGVACEGETQPVPVCGMCGVLFDSVVPHFG
jgi:cathepsin L|mmetsp:Transcript_115354/g.180202  ORF Transcript_115354/g.180202 Transcript_115354/m.180202 type:complete len:378 (+) Transcript_115354:66-1199(+)